MCTLHFDQFDKNVKNISHTLSVFLFTKMFFSFHVSRTLKVTIISHYNFFAKIYYILIEITHVLFYIKFRNTQVIRSSTLCYYVNQSCLFRSILVLYPVSVNDV